jgi:molecular chaperone GrpE
MMPSESEEKQSAEAIPDIAENEDIESLRQALTEEQAKAEANLAGWQRAQADFSNFKKRIEQEREDFTRFANASLILELLPLLDDLERALEHVPAKLANLAWVDGVKLIYRKFRATLESQGLSQIEALDKPFDPNLHEAVRQDKGEEGIVIEEIRKGYQLQDKVIRPTMVVVGNGEDTEKEAE